MARGKVRIPYKLLGTIRACALHDFIVARRLEKLAGRIDIVHTWALGSLRTLKVASKLGIPAVLERSNAHTGFAYKVVREECERIGIALPRKHEHAHKEEVLRKEEEEYRLAYRLLCPSDFVVQTFLNQGFQLQQLVRHIYGYDEKRFYPATRPRDPKPGLTALFAGMCAEVKGLHFALEAWLGSPASRDGFFLIAGSFSPAYAAKLAPMLAHPSVKFLGPRNDLPELMQKTDILILPSLVEGFGLVITEAMGSGCVPLASDACTELCKHMENGLVHHVGDVKALSGHITLLYDDRALLEKLRSAALRDAPSFTWKAAGIRLLKAYDNVISNYHKK
ncbi:MAG: glycosyltransferase family 4 protein [Nitrospiraceae bacterium]|nr:glycosyltransferase family 4 protein [Nitrospiraceae bacterium]